MKTIVLNQLDTATASVLRSLRHGYAAAVIGQEGAGVTVACNHIIGNWKNAGGRKVLAFTAFPEGDMIKLLQYFASLVLGGEMPGDWGLHAASNLIHLMSKKIKTAGVGLLVLDRADLAPEGFIDAIMTMCSNCSTEEHHVSLLLGMRMESRQARLFREFSFTHVATVAELKPLDPGAIAAIMAESCDCFSKIPLLLESKDQTALAAIMELHKLSGGNFRRIDQFVSYVNDMKAPVDFTGASIRRTWHESFQLGDMAA